MSADLSTADSRELSEPFADRLATVGPAAALLWLTDVLASQSPGLRSANAFLVGYTGCADAIEWLEARVGSPVTDSWGRAAALLGAPWARRVDWLRFGGSRRLMALDSLLACRAPAPNMAPLDQIAAPTLPDPPTIRVLETTMAAVLEDGATPRVRTAVQTILDRAAEILERRERNVPVEDLPKLYLHPEAFAGAQAVLDRQAEVVSGMRQSLNVLVDRFRSN